MGRGGQGGLPPIGVSGGCGGGMAPFAQQTPARNVAPMYSNIRKRYANWSICFLCGFDAKDGQTSKTCPAQWRRANHQEGFNRRNARLNVYLINYRSKPSGHSSSKSADIAFVFLFWHSTGIQEQSQRSDTIPKTGVALVPPGRTDHGRPAVLKRR